MKRQKRGCVRGVAWGCVVSTLLAIGLCCAGLSVPAGFRGWAAARESEPATAVGPGRFVQTRGGRIHLTEWGESTDSLILMVPGSNAWSETWVEVAKPLAQNGYYVVGLDLPPFGYSERPSNPDGYTREAQAERILGVIEQLKADEVVLVGHSFGGGATVEAAMRAEPGQLSHLVLVDTALALGMEPSPWVPVARTPGVAGPLVSMTFTNPWFLPVGVESLVFNPSNATAERVARYARPLNVDGTTAAITAWLPELLAPTAGRSSDEAHYRQMTTPTTVIWGAEDTTTPPDQGRHIDAILPDSVYEEIPQVAHIPQIERPDEVTRIILENLRTRTSPTPPTPDETP